jgi:hypothetical protein
MCSVVIGDQNKPNNVDAMSLYLSEGFFGFGSPESNFDITACADKNELNKKILANYSKDKRPEKIAVDQYWKIAKEAKVGDRIFLTSYKGIIYACGVITDSYKFSDMKAPDNSPRGRFRHSIGVDWRVKDTMYSWKKWLPVDFGIPSYDEWNSIIAPEIERKLRSPMNQNLILCGPPGTGKTYLSFQYAVDACLAADDQFYIELNKIPKDAEEWKMDTYKEKYRELADEGRIEFTTFHQNYDYSDFIQGIRPRFTDAGGIGYDLVRGPLWKIANRAMLSIEKNEDKDFAIIIDEINRGNLAKIFGELITLVEVDKRDVPGGTNVRLPLLYGSSDKAEAGIPVCKEYSLGKFCLPPNLHFIGTMNSADKSVQRMDSALRRRFDFVDMPPEPHLLKDNPKLVKFLTVLNRRLQDAKPGSGCLIGHAWFMQQRVALPCSHTKLMCNAFNNKIFPLLSEWFWNEGGALKNLFGGAGRYVDARSGQIKVIDPKLTDPKQDKSAENFIDLFMLDDDQDITEQ